MGGYDRSPIRDSALQGERTALAWNRTAAGLLVNALLALRTGLAEDSAPLVFLALVVVLVAAATFVFARVRRRTLVHPVGSIAVSARALLAITAAVVVAALTGLGAVWV